MNTNRTIRIVAGAVIIAVPFALTVYLGYRAYKLYKDRDKELDNNGDSIDSGVKGGNNSYNYEASPTIKALRKQINASDYAMETICPSLGKRDDNGDMTYVVNCQKRTPYTAGLAQSVWIQMKKSEKKMKKLINLSTESIRVKNYGNSLISVFSGSIDKKFKPIHYNTNKSWYKSYLARGGTPI